MSVQGTRAALTAPTAQAFSAPRHMQTRRRREVRYARVVSDWQDATCWGGATCWVGTSCRGHLRGGVGRGHPLGRGHLLEQNQEGSQCCRGWVWGRGQGRCGAGVGWVRVGVWVRVWGGRLLSALLCCIHGGLRAAGQRGQGQRAAGSTQQPGAMMGDLE